MNKAINLKNTMPAYIKYENAQCLADWYRAHDVKTALKEAEDMAQTTWIAFLETTATLTAAIDEAQKRCTSRTIEAKDVCKALAAVEKKLNLPKLYLNGVSVTIDCNAQDFPNAYKYTPESTHFKATYKSGSWRVTNIWRGETSKSSRGTVVTLTEEAKAAILDRALEEYTAF